MRMKKILFLMMMFITLSLNAEEATSSCMVGNSNTEYVQATAYTTKDGTSKGSASVTIANGSNKPLLSLYITVTAEKCTAFSNRLEWTPVTLYKGNKFFDPAVAPNSTTKIQCNSVSSYGGELRNIDIKIGNPSCR